MIRSRPGLVGIAVLFAVSGCNATPEYLQREARQRSLAREGVESFDSTGTLPLAGVSAVWRIDVEPLRPRDLHGDTLGVEYDVYRASCGACHAVPAPSAKRAYEWSSYVGRMRKNAEDAGLMPMDREEEARVLRFLQRHAR